MSKKRLARVKHEKEQNWQQQRKFFIIGGLVIVGVIVAVLYFINQSVGFNN